MKAVISSLVIIVLCSHYISCGMYEPDINYVNCDWFQYADENISDCEDVNWCNNLTYSGKKVRRAYIFYNNIKPNVDNKFFVGGVDVVLYESYKTTCIEYIADNNEIGILGSEFSIQHLMLAEA